MDGMYVSFCLLSMMLALAGFFLMRRRQEIRSLRQTIQSQESQLTELKIEKASLEVRFEEWQKTTQEKMNWLEQSKSQLTEAFKSVSFESLEKNNQAFLSLAQATLEKYQQKAEGHLEQKKLSIHALFDPMKESLGKLQEGMTLIEKERKGEQEVLKEHLKKMVEAEKELKEETATLVRALRMPNVRGRWGEMQLRRVVELCGMLNHCDFFEQPGGEKEEGRLRPDMVIKLPGDKQVIVDAKTPFEAYFDATQSDDLAVKKDKLKQHARHVRSHIIALGKKSYWESFEPTPEFVVLFLPSESFFSAALEEEPSLIEIGIEHKIVIATPVTLIGLLRAIAYGWKQEKLTAHTKEIYEMGKELYKRICDCHQHITKMGKSLSSSVEHYNKMVGSLETRVLVSARKFAHLGIGTPDLQNQGVQTSGLEIGEEGISLQSLAAQPKTLTAVEFSEAAEEIV